MTAPRALDPERPDSLISRMTRILDTFDRYGSSLTLVEVACRTRIPRSTTHRILDQLVRLEWVEHTTSGYRLGRRATTLGSDGKRDEIRSAAAPFLHELQLRTGMIVHLAVLDGHENVYLDKLGGPFATSLPTRVGGRSPAYSTASGKSMLAWLDPETVDVLHKDPLIRHTPHTITDLPGLRRELNRIRRRFGLAFEREEFVRGVACVGVALRGQLGPVAGISLCGDARTAQLDRAVPQLLNATRAVSHRLGLQAM